eukprot:2182303-Rhodomonas_salina.1
MVGVGSAHRGHGAGGWGEAAGGNSDSALERERGRERERVQLDQCSHVGDKQRCLHLGGAAGRESLPEQRPHLPPPRLLRVASLLALALLPLSLPRLSLCLTTSRAAFAYVRR